MMEAMPPSSVKVTRCTAVSPPKVLVTSIASKRGNPWRSSAMRGLIARRGGPRYGPPDPSSERGYAPLGLPRTSLGRAPAQPWRASGLTQDVSSLAQFALPPPRGEDALRPEDHHENEDQPEDHPLVLGGLQLRGQARQVVAEDRHARVLQLVEPE